MRFLVLLAEPDHFDHWQAADDDVRSRTVADFNAFGDAVRDRGSIVAGDALDRPESARTVQPGAASGPGSGRVVTAGPYAETVEQVGGFYLIDVADLDVALELAALLPREYSVEVRPTVEVDL